MPPKRSFVWNHFNDVSQSKAQCMYCLNYISVNNGNVSNMARHIRNQHPEILITSEKLFIGDAKENLLKSSKSAQKQRKSHHQVIFEKVRRYCVELVKQCDRPIEILDDVPFRNILNLIVVRDGDRKNLTAAAIQEFIDNDGDALEDTTMDETTQLDDDDDHDFDNDDGDSDYAPPGGGTASQKHGAIKGEKIQCNCQGQDGDESGEHKVGCPMHSDQHYWAYFEVSVEDARCKECHSNVKWTTMTDLKTHLDLYHSHLRYKDDDENFNSREAMSEAGSFENQEATEEVFLDTEAFTTEKQPIRPKKRKLPLFQTQKYVTLKDSQTITLDRFKCLDRFGLYIAALMKMIPEDKCIKYQEQIVNRLLREQAAAG